MASGRPSPSPPPPRAYPSPILSTSFLSQIVLRYPAKKMPSITNTRKAKAHYYAKIPPRRTYATLIAGRVPLPSIYPFLT